MKDIQIEYVPISSIHPNEYNPKKISDKDREDLKMGEVYGKAS